MVLERLLDRWRERRANGNARVTDASRDLRIVRLLKRRGGRATQKDIVEELDVTKSTVSRDLDGLEADGIVSRHRVGRTNAVELERDGAIDALARRGDPPTQEGP